MDRSNFVEADEYGVDPLSGNLIDKIMSIASYTEHTVASDEECNPQLLAYKYYNNVELYFIILFYNGIGNSFALEKGTKLQIPSINDVQRILTEKKYSSASGNAVTTMEI